MMRSLTLLLLMLYLFSELAAQPSECSPDFKRIPLTKYTKGMTFYFPLQHSPSSDAIFTSRFSGVSSYSKIAGKKYVISDTSSYRDMLYYDRFQPGPGKSPANDRVQRIYSIELVNVADTSDKFTYDVSVDSATFQTPPPYPAMLDNAFLQGAIAVEEFEAAKKWLINRVVYTLFEVKGRKYEKGAIIDVVYGSWETPLGVVYQDDGKQVTDTIYVNLVGTNVPYSYVGTFHYSKYFTCNDPQGKIPLDRWNLIRSGKPEIGMKEDELLLALGKPKQVEETREKDTSKTVYTFDKYVVYFENGIAVKIVSVTRTNV